MIPKLLRGLGGVALVLLIVAHLGFVLIRSVPGNPKEAPVITTGTSGAWRLSPE